jgi:hypothetical protein
VSDPAAGAALTDEMAVFLTGRAGRPCVRIRSDATAASPCAVLAVRRRWRRWQMRVVPMPMANARIIQPRSARLVGGREVEALQLGAIPNGASVAAWYRTQ